MVSEDSLLEDALKNLRKVTEENEQREQEYKIRADTACNSLYGVSRDLIVDCRARRFFDHTKEIVLFDFPSRNGKKTGIGFVMGDGLQIRVGSESVTEEKGFYEAFRRYSGIGDDDDGIKEFLDKINREEILRRIAGYSPE